MRFTLAVVVLIGTLLISGMVGTGPSYGQSSGQSSSPSAAPSPAAPMEAPVGHRQPKQSDVPPRPSDNSQTANPDANSRLDLLDPKQDEKMNRILNGICRGC